MKRAGFTLLEVLVAIAVLAIGVAALQRLLVRSIASVAQDAQVTRAMFVARGLLAEAAAAPPDLGLAAGVRADLGWEREVTAAGHPALREVRVRVRWDDGPGVQLVEVVRVATP